MPEQSKTGSDGSEVFRATPEVRGGIACFTGTRGAYRSYSATSGTATRLTIS